MPLFGAVALVIVLALAVAATSGIAAWLALINPGTRLNLGSSKEVLDIAKLALAVSGGMGAAGALVVAYRKQLATEAEHQRNERAEQRDLYRRFTERFHEAVLLIGNSDSAAVRLSGIYSLTDLANDWPEGRQRCIDVLCAYIRLPFNPESCLPGESEVRQTVFTVMHDHLTTGAEFSWDGYNFDLRGATIEGADFSRLTLEKSVINLSRIRLVGGDLNFEGTLMQGGFIDLSHGNFSAGRLRLDGLFIRYGSISFAGAIFAGTPLIWEEGAIHRGSVVFDQCSFEGSRVRLHRVSVFAALENPENAPLRFAGITIKSGEVSLGGINYLHNPEYKEFAIETKGQLLRGAPRGPVWVNFAELNLQGGALSFRNARVQGGILSLPSAHLAGGELSFENARFENAEVNLEDAHLKGASLNFRQSHFTATKGDSLSNELREWVADLERRPVPERDMVWETRPYAALQFLDSEFESGSLILEHARLASALIDLVGVEFRGGNVLMKEMDCTSAVINLWNSRFDFEKATDFLISGHPRLTLMYSSYGNIPISRIASSRGVKVLEVSASD